MKRAPRRTTGRHVAALLAGVLAPSLAFATNGYFAHGYGMKAKGMAGVGIALPQDALAAATNPAGIAFVGDRVDLGLDWFHPSRGAEIVGNGGIPPFGIPSLNGTYSGNGKSNFFIPEFGYNRTINDKFSAGIAVFGNGGMNTQYNASPFARLGGSNPAGVDLSQLFVAPTLAYKVTPEQSLGVSLNLAYQRFKATGLEPFGAFGFSADPANLTNNGYAGSTGYGLRLGWTGKFGDVFTAGATYQSKTRMSRFDRYAGLFADQGDFDIPANYGVGVAARPAPGWTLAADVQWIDYSGVPAVGNPINSLFAGQQLGSTNGPGFGWKDMTVYKFGAAWEMNPSTTLRAGVSYGSQPIPSSQTFFNILAPGTVETHLTLGGTWVLAGGNELTFAYAYMLKKTVNGSGSIPPNLGGGEANIWLSEQLLGVSYAWKF